MQKGRAGDGNTVAGDGKKRRKEEGPMGRVDNGKSG